ncbi:MAG: EMC3/TMCO1 family protein [Thermoplasmata archaeon]
MGTGGGPGRAGAPRPDFGGQMLLLLAMLMAIFILFDNDIRQGLGRAVGVVLQPAFGFDGRMPVITLLLTGLLTSCFTITVRQLFTDWVGQARAARIASAFNKELREARQSNNTYKLKKLTELQPQIMSAQLKASQTQLKLMPVTMIIIVPTFAWLANFVYMDLQSTTFSVPWEFNASMKGSNVLPNWILLYSLLTLPFGQLLTRALKYFSFSRKLEKLERGVPEAREKAEEG